MEVLKNFAFNSTTSSLNERKVLFEELFICLDSKEAKDLPDAAFKLLGKLNYNLFPNYSDKFSKKKLICLNKKLVELNYDQSIKGILSGLYSYSKICSFNEANQSINHLSFNGLDILNDLIMCIYDFHKEKLHPKNEEFVKLVHIYSNFVLGACSGLKKNEFDICFKKLSTILNKIPEIGNKFESVFIDEQSEEILSSCRFLLLGGFILQYYNSSKASSFNNFKSFLLDIYLKHCLGSRSKLRLWLIKCHNFFLKYINKDEFKEKILTAIQRGLLRNPEIILRVVGNLLEDLSIDLSEFSSELIKVVRSQLLAKDKENQEEAAYAIKSLTKQCSNKESIIAILASLFDLLNGEGKSASIDQRQTIIFSIGNCSFNCCQTNTQDVLLKLIQLFSEYLKNETNESMIIFAISQLKIWLESLKIQTISTEILNKLNDFFKKLLENKTYSSIIRVKIFKSMFHVYSIQTAHLINFLPHCLQIIEKAQTGTSQNSPIFNEALCASLVLAVYLNADISLEPKLSVFLNFLNDPKKQFLTNDKFVQSLNEEGLEDYCELFGKLVEINCAKEIVNLSLYYKGYSFVLLHPNFKARKHSQDLLKKMFKWDSSKMIICLCDYVNSSAIDNSGIKLPSEIQGELEWPSPKSLIEFVYTLANIKNLTASELEALSLKCLILCNSKLAKRVDKNLFKKFIYKIIDNNKTTVNMSVQELLGHKKDEFIQLVTTGQFLSESQLNSIESLCRIDENSFLQGIIDYALNLLNSNPSLASISKQDFEIMKLKEGELYEKSLIESVLKQINDEKTSNSNFKRESKAYSYKEQLADMELRKELEAKKSVSYKLKTNQETSSSSSYNLDQIRTAMTKKQAELLDAQILRESNIREETKKADSLINKTTCIFLKVVESNSINIKLHIGSIIKTIIKFVKSPLCASYVFKIYDALSVYVKTRSLNEINALPLSSYKSIVNNFFRLSDSDDEFIDGCWMDDPLKHSYTRLIFSLKKEIGSVVDLDEIDLFKSSFLYPFFKYAMIQNSIEEECLKNIIEIIFKFSSDRNKVQKDTLSDQNLNKDERYLAYKFEELIKEFLSTEYLSLLMQLTRILIENNYSLNTQNRAAEALQSIFEFSCQMIFVHFDSKSLLGKNNINMLMENFNSEVKELIKGLFCEHFFIREICLNCFQYLVNQKTNSSNTSETFCLDEETFQDLTHRLLVSCFDVEESNRVLAAKIWKQGNFKSNGKICLSILNDIVHPVENVRLAASEALANVIKENHLDMASTVLQSLQSTYEEKNVIIQPKLDQFGRPINNQQSIDEWESRASIGNALSHLAESVPTNDGSVLDLFTFFLYKSLNDRNQVVKDKMLDASIACLNFHGRSHINELLPLFENFLQNTPNVASYDSVRQNAVILMGTLAKHLEKDDAKVAPIIGKLVQALQCPSQQVQEAVAKCLPPLMPSIKNQVPVYVNQLLNLLLTAKTYGERRGAAYGLAGMLKGMGMLSLRQLNVLQRLNEAVNNKEDAKQREGALLAYEMLTVIFSKVFEPYSVEILPNLLLCFGDSDANVRKAADDCAKAIMANLTFTGVKMILPKLLERLGEEESWRTKCGSVELLGAMAHCAPKQLSSCLPNIVPKLIEILSDSHVKVQKAGTQALRQIGSVIKNPEILTITNTLLEALQDPALKTHKALQVLLETKFVHFIDAPSLALIMPVVQRAFQDRSTEIRKMAAQIMGNMYSLTDQKDLLPYLPAILPGLKLSLLDPVPEVRSVSSKALGAMIRAIGENGLNDIISWLMEKLVSESSSVDRSGAAQGLSEVFGALGVSKLDKSMPEIIERAIQVDLSPYVRDGYMMMFIYLPLTFGEDFTTYVGQIIQPILKALADDSEFVRDTAIKAGQRIVNTYAETAISLFLPELEKGLFDSNWRIRFSSVQLLGDLLYKISGVVGKMSTESAHEDDNFGTEKGSAAIITALGKERRNKVYSGLYMGRSDVSLQVRQAALHVWKIIVSNTPKTLREILPTLFGLLLGCLASANHDKRQIAASTLVDIVKKLGERVLPDIIPILENGLNSERSEQRQGVCIGLTEIMANTSRDNIIAFSDSLVPTVCRALMDPLPDVRYFAAKTFDNLHNMIGLKALDEVVLHLFEELKKNETQQSREISDRALDGLKQIMKVKSRVILPYLIPHLMQPPVNINALCKLCCCASTDVLSKHLNKILTTLVNAIAIANKNKQSTTTEKIVSDESNTFIMECESLLLSINDPEGVQTIITDLIGHAISSEQSTTKLTALDMLAWFCEKTDADYTDHIDDLIRALMSLFTEKNEDIVVKAWNCLNSILEPLKGNTLIQRLPTIRQSMRLIVQSPVFHESRLFDTYGNTDSKIYLPGFCLPKKGLSCILPVFKEGLLNGSPDIKEQSAATLCECIRLSDSASLKASVMAITGPLIRVLGERYSSSLKSVILDAIYFLLLKVEITLKPFLPQLQPTFLKNLVDINRTIRLKSGFALAKLLFMNPKMDTIINELLNYIKSNEDVLIKETLLNTLRLCINNVGSNLNDETKSLVLKFLHTEDYVFNSEYSIRAVSSGSIGSLAPYLSEKDFTLLFKDVLDFQKYENKNWKYLHANCMILCIAFKYCPNKLYSNDKCLTMLSFCANSDRIPVCMSSIRTICFFLDYQIRNNLKAENEIAQILSKCINHNSTEIKLLAIQSILFLSSSANNKPLDGPLLKCFIPMLVNGTRESAPLVRSRSEIALISIIRMNKPDSILTKCLELLDSMKESFQDCIKSLSNESLSQTVNIDFKDLDETLLKME